MKVFFEEQSDDFSPLLFPVFAAACVVAKWHRTKRETEIAQTQSDQKEEKEADALVGQ